METLNITKTNVFKAHKEADKKGKELLENLFGKEVLSQKITDRIKTFEDACNKLEVAPDYSFLLAYKGTDADMLSAHAYMKLIIIARALNEGWEPDWTDSSETKYYPWFNNYKPGVGFSRSGYDCWRTYASCGSRLCFKSSELAMYAGTQFIEIYNQFLIIK